MGPIKKRRKYKNKNKWKFELGTYFCLLTLFSNGYTWNNKYRLWKLWISATNPNFQEIVLSISRSYTLTGRLKNWKNWGVLFFF